MTFPVLWQGGRALHLALREAGCPRRVPWSLVAPHEEQSVRNHGQSLRRLAERGGLSPAELLCVLEDRGLRGCGSDVDAVARLLLLLAQHEGGS